MESLLAGAVGPEHVLAAGPALADYGHDEALGVRPGEPAFVVKPGSTAEVAGVLRIAGERGLAVTARGAAPLILEYIDARTMAVIAQGEDLDLGIPGSVRESARAYLVVMQEERDPGRLDADVADVAELLARVGAADVYVLPATAARRLVEAREKAFWAAKRAGADDIVDAVVPRAAMAAFLGEVARIAARHDRLVLGAGHAGDGNVHLALFEPDDAARGQMMREILAAARVSGGAVSGEHGIGTAKVSYFLELADPVAVSLMRRIKDSFDPAGILNPGVLFG